MPVLDPDAGQMRTERGQMDAPTLVNFPLPMLTMLLCSVIALLVWRLELGVRRTNVALSVLFGLCALEAFLVGIRFGYGIDTLIPLQRALPLLLGPVMYLGFVSTMVSTRVFLKIMAIHVSAPIIVMMFLWLLIGDLRALDWVISASYLIYAVTLYVLWCKGPDALIYARVEVSHSLSKWILRGVGLLIFTFLMDTAIAIDFALNRGTNVAALISYGTVPLILVLLLIVIKLPAITVQPAKGARAGEDTSAQDMEIKNLLDQLMETEQLFLDPELSVQRLAKRLHLPARNVSGAINRTKGMNVSQYVNSFRLAHAADLLASGSQSVIKIAEQSGFLARSNFYREFQRVYDQSPTDYRKSRKRAATSTA